MVFVSDSKREGMWPVRWCNKDRIALISTPAQRKLLEEHLSTHMYRQPPELRQTGKLWLRSSTESNDGSFVTRMTTPHTLLQPSSSALLCVSHISAFFFFFMEFCSGWGENTNVVYWLITAHGLEWSLLKDKQIFLITFTFSQLTVSWWRAFPSLSKRVSRLGSMSQVIPLSEGPCSDPCSICMSKCG